MKIKQSLLLVLAILCIGIWIVLKKILPEFDLKDFIEGFVFGQAIVLIIWYIIVRFRKD